MLVARAVAVAGTVLDGTNVVPGKVMAGNVIAGIVIRIKEGTVGEAML
jgi:hypothetical protein